MEVSIMVLLAAIIVWLILNTWSVVCLRQDIRNLSKQVRTRTPRGILD